MSSRKESELSEKQVTELRDTFFKFDEARRGTVPFVHLDEIFRTVSRVIVDPKFKRSVKNPSAEDATRTVQFPEFMQMVTANTRPLDPVLDLQEAFRVFDRDGHGFITTAELRHVVTTLGERMTDEEADELIKEADVNSDGHIDYERFIKAIVVPKDKEAAPEKPRRRRKR